jgi:hypothetical protein
VADVLTDRLARAVELTDLLAADLDDGALVLHNGAAPSNTVGLQFWCVVGARESYGRAIERGEWAGFECSLRDPGVAESVRDALASAGSRVRALCASLERPLDPARESLVFDLLEHEVQHHGQLVRYFYANGLAFPERFADRYALTT